MTADGWREAALKAVRLNDHGDPSMLDLLAQLLAEQDARETGPTRSRLRLYRDARGLRRWRKSPQRPTR